MTTSNYIPMAQENTTQEEVEKKVIEKGKQPLLTKLYTLHELKLKLQKKGDTKRLKTTDKEITRLNKKIAKLVKN